MSEFAILLPIQDIFILFVRNAVKPALCGKSSVKDMFGKRILCILGKHKWKVDYQISKKFRFAPSAEGEIRITIECDRCGKFFMGFKIPLPRHIGKPPRPKKKIRIPSKFIKGSPKTPFYKRLWSGKGKIE